MRHRGESRAGYLLAKAAALAILLLIAMFVIFALGIVFVYVAAAIANVPFVVQPIQRGFQAIPRDVRDAAACCGLSAWRQFVRIELPLAWPSVLTASILAFAHTLGEFGVVLMVGGNLPGRTRTMSVAIYDRMQAFDDRSAGIMAATLLAIAVATLMMTTALSRRVGVRRG